MKKLLIGIMTILLSGCYILGEKPISPELPLEEAWQKMATFTYQFEETEYFKSPEEFEADGGGDCDDFAVYMVYLLGSKAYFVGIDRGDTNHAIVEYRGEYLEPQTFGKYYDENSLDIVTVMGYDEVMMQATMFGMK